ncbi:hypothetical protein [Rhabdothermincola sediminis]|uniref:hypothetical protein n=1 Tax=Rhabdothermincola sediminis TaxID=2751370 RepID=UPI001AA07514|nr:hypothetical protein [Rhabdothermincola sediminis]
MAARPDPGARATALDPSVLEAVLDAIGDLVVVVEPAGRTVHLNRAARAALGPVPGDDPATAVAASLFSPGSWRMLETEAIPAAVRGEVWQGGWRSG